MVANQNIAVSYTLSAEQFPIAGQFRISRGVKTHADVLCVTLSTNDATGRGECVPYARYGETMQSVSTQIQNCCSAHANLADLIAACRDLPPGAARNAVDCALWDLEAKRTGHAAHRRICDAPPRPIRTALTLSLDTPENMATAARRVSDRSLIKIKLGGENDIACMHAVVANAPKAEIIIDANEGWSGDKLPVMMQKASKLGIALIEQPLPTNQASLLTSIPHPVPVCADECVHTTKDLDVLVGRYDVINIKLDKTGGLSEAIRMQKRARELGFGVMVGCMVGTSLAMAPAVLLAQDADYVDLDGPLLLAKDRPHGLDYIGDVVSPPTPALWG